MFQGACWDRESPAKYNKLWFGKFIDVPVVESVVLDVDVVVGVVLSVVCTKTNLLKVIEYTKETNMLVILKVADY